MARPRKPTAQKKAQGTNRKHRENKDEPIFSALDKNSPSPEYFNKYSKALWSLLLNEFEKHPILQITDTPALEMMCAAYGFWREGTEIINKNTCLMEHDTNGGPSVLMQQINKSFSQCEKLMSRFGLTPSDRARIGLNKNTEIDPKTKKLMEMEIE